MTKSVMSPGCLEYCTIMEFAALKPSFAARTFSGDVRHMTETFQEGLKHKGFAFIEVLQSCPTYNLMTPHEWYQKRLKDIREFKNYNVNDIEKALEIAIAQISTSLNSIVLLTFFKLTRNYIINKSSCPPIKIKTEIICYYPLTYSKYFVSREGYVVNNYVGFRKG